MDTMLLWELSRQHRWSPRFQMVHYYYIVCGALLTHCFLNAGSGYCHLPEFDLLRLSRFTVCLVYAFL